MEDPQNRREKASPDRDGGAGMDPTRKLLKVFVVKVTDYEARTDALLGRAAGATGETRLVLLEEALELTADLDHWLREVTSHVLERQERVLTSLRRG